MSFILKWFKMTLSNFDWTDKDSVKWFIMLPTGHEGPYSLNAIEERCSRGKLSFDAKIWAEGLTSPVQVNAALEAACPSLPELPGEDEMLDLPPLPIEDEMPPLPEEALARDEEALPPPKKKFPVLVVSALLSFCLIVFGAFQWIKGGENIDVRRRPGMSVKIHEKILQDLVFESWDKKIFFKEYVPLDLSHIWLATSSFQTCEVEASFHSVKDKLLSLEEEEVAFKTKGKLSQHLVEFSSFDFITGSKIIPGLYELDIRAENCQWEGFLPALANRFLPPDESYEAQTKVVLYPNGASEFNQVLDKLLRKKLEADLLAQNQEELFWQDLSQKFQTLLAIGLQVEQHLLDFVEKGPKQFNQGLPAMVDSYTRKFGHFLTNFVVSNENYFKELAETELKNLSQKKNYELMVRTTTRNLGFASMKIIEDLQKLKRPQPAQLAQFRERIKKTFSDLKNEINQKIIQISDDRSP